MKKHLSIFALSMLLFSANSVFAQGVAVNTDGSTADPSAMLDVKSNNRGILIPRVSSTTSITSPVTGLLIFQTTAPVGFYYYDGATWDYLQNSANANVTLQGNTFNTANNLLKLDGSGKVPIANLGTSGTPSASTYLNGNDAWVSVPAGMANGTAAGQVYLTGGSPFAPQAPQSVTGDVTINSVAVTSYNNVVPANKGGAGTLTGVLQANGSGTVSSISTTGSGNVVLASAPILVAPSLGIPTTLVGTNISGTAANLTAGAVTTNANMTGDVTSGGNATTIANTATGGTHIVTAINNAGTTGTIAVARLGTGATPTNFLRGDGTFATPAGGSSTTALAFISSLLNLALAGSPTLYFNPNAGSVVGTHTGVTYTGANDFADVDNMIIPFACTISSLTVTSNTILTGAGSDNTTFTVYKNGAAQGMGCLVTNTITVGNISSMTDNTHTFNVVAGDRISISFKESNINGTSAPYISYSVVLRTQ